MVCAHAEHQAHNRDTSFVHPYQLQAAQLSVSLDLGAFAPAVQDFADVPSADGTVLVNVCAWEDLWVTPEREDDCKICAIHPAVFAQVSKALAGIRNCVVVAVQLRSALDFSKETWRVPAFHRCEPRTYSSGDCRSRWDVLQRRAMSDVSQPRSTSAAPP